MTATRAGRAPDRGFSPRRPPVAKAVLDRAVAGLLLLLAAPWLALVAMAIWFDTRGPILSREKRVGQWGETFDLLRFRSTHDRAEPLSHAAGGSLLTGQTRVGRVLRRYSLHELPQLINVLAGDMSLVGPRPQRRVVGGVYGDDLRRLILKPGLTGLWLAGSPRRGERDTLVALDHYLEHWSLRLDLAILCHCALVALRRGGEGRR